MSDPIHMCLSKFRDSILSSVAHLEFQLRDVTASHTTQTAAPISVADETVRKELQDVRARMAEMEETMTMLMEKYAKQDTIDMIRQELLSIQPSLDTKNILISSVRNTPALQAAVAAANPPDFQLEDSEDDDTLSSILADEEDTDQIVDVPEEIKSEGDVEDEPLKQVVIQGTSYYMDNDNLLYHETEDGYEQIGSYDPVHDTIELLVEDSEDQDSEEAVEVEEFEYKGKTYQRDNDGIVYLDGEEIGTWNGTRILRSV